LRVVQQVWGGQHRGRRRERSGEGGDLVKKSFDQFCRKRGKPGGGIFTPWNSGGAGVEAPKRGETDKRGDAQNWDLRKNKPSGGGERPARGGSTAWVYRESHLFWKAPAWASNTKKNKHGQASYSKKG